MVWRYLFRRDDDEPAPWTPEGIARTERLGLAMYDPDNSNQQATTRYVIPPELLKVIDQDEQNARYWEAIKEEEFARLTQLMTKVFEEVSLAKSVARG